MNAWTIRCPTCDLELEARSMDEMEVRAELHMRTTGHMDLTILDEGPVDLEEADLDV